jgi:hypothetical protein
MRLMLTHVRFGSRGRYAQDNSDMLGAPGHSALGHAAPEEFDQRSSNGECGKQQAEPEDSLCQAAYENPVKSLR